MKALFLTLAAAALCAPAWAGPDVGVSVDISQPGLYGRIDIGNVPPPVVMYPQPVVIQQAELSQALATGVIESLMTSGSTGYDTKIYESIKNFYDTQAWLPKNAVLVNLKAFNALDGHGMKLLAQGGITPIVIDLNHDGIHTIARSASSAGNR